MQNHFATIEAYARKEEMGGGFRGVIRFRDGRTAYRTDVFEDKAGAWLAVRNALIEIMGDKSFVYGHYRGNPYRKNVFI